MIPEAGLRGPQIEETYMQNNSENNTDEELDKDEDANKLLIVLELEERVKHEHSE